MNWKINEENQSRNLWLLALARQGIGENVLQVFPFVKTLVSPNQIVCYIFE